MAVVTGYQHISLSSMENKIKNGSTPGLNVLNEANLQTLATLDAEHITKVQKEIQTTKDNAKNVSKVVDEDGEPLVVYHGTNRYGYTVFDTYLTQSRDKANVGTLYVHIHNESRNK